MFWFLVHHSNELSFADEMIRQPLPANAVGAGASVRALNAALAAKTARRR
jgi:hypothetical protein